MKKYILSFAFTLSCIIAIQCSTTTIEAAGYDVKLNGLVLYLSKAEATKVARSLEDGRNIAGLATIFAGWIPHVLIQRCTQTLLGLSTWKANQLATGLSRCGKRGATLNIPWPTGPGGTERACAGMSVANR